MSRIVLSLLVDNTAGVLSRVAGLFSRRGYNIQSIYAGQTKNPAISRIIIEVPGDDFIINQVKNQVNKLVDVIEISEPDADAAQAMQQARENIIR